VHNCTSRKLKTFFGYEFKERDLQEKRTEQANRNEGPT